MYFLLVYFIYMFENVDMSACWYKMIENCWKTMLSTLTILLDSSRDAFIACICKTALPAGYFSNNLHSVLSKHILEGNLSTEKLSDSQAGNSIVVC